MKKDITKEFIAQKVVDKWIKKNPEFMKDAEELAAEVAFFNTKWGSDLEIKDFFEGKKENNK